MDYNFDINKLKSQVADVIKESQGLYFTDISADKIIDDWLEAKKDFIRAMKGNLIYQLDYPITFNLDKKSKEDRLYKFADFIQNHYENENLCDFLYSINIEDFYNNKTSKVYECFITDEQFVKIPENFKVIKAFKFFESNKYALKELQNEASRIIQEDCITGYLCFSVHPLDFLSASENAHNWRSCHALDGEYRSGNLNYLMDKSTVICYLKSDKDVELPHFPSELHWNSKKWRTWVYFSNDKSMVFIGRQYPFISQKGISYITERFLPELGFGNWSNFYSSRIQFLEDELSSTRFFFEKFIPVGETIRPLKQLVVEGKNTHAYNDILKSTCYETPYAYNTGDSKLGWRTYNKTGRTNDKTQFFIGKECRCPICEDGYIDFENIMACRDCATQYDIGDNEDYQTCDICGISVYYEDIYTLDITDMHICNHCYQEETKVCQRCHCTDVPEMVKYHNGQYLCVNCIKELEGD